MAAFPDPEGPDIVERLVSDVAEGVRVLVTRDKIPLTEAQVLERARGIASSILGNYDLRLLPVAGLRMTVDFDTTPGKPVAHTWSCKCDKCDLYNRSVRR